MTSTSVGAPARPALERRWNVITRIAFRFCFSYFVLFLVLYPQFLFEYIGWFKRWLPEGAISWQVEVLEPVYAWVGREVLGVNAIMHDTGSGDQMILWVLLFCVLVVAVVTTALWSLLDRRRTEYRQLAGWFLLFVRLCLAGQVIAYGMTKLIPSQMPEPGLRALLEPFGNFAPMGVLWNQVGSSPTYEIMLGLAEVLGGTLLFVPRTALLGAMISFISMAQVFLLNMTFDVPVKIFAGHMLLMCAVLLAPEAQRLTRILLLDRTTGPSTQPQPFRTNRTRIIAVAVQAALGIWILFSTVLSSWQGWRDFGAGRVEPPFYGIWTVTEFSRDGQPVPALVGDETRWRRVLFELSGMVEYQLMDDSFDAAALTIDTATHRLELAEQDTPTLLASFTFQQPNPDQLRLTGVLSEQPVLITLERLDLNTFPLRSRGFHWVQDDGTFGAE